MDVELASYLLSWLAHIDVACIVCNWDPATGTYVPAAGAAGAAAGGLAGAGPWFPPPNPYYTPPGSHGNEPPDPHDQRHTNQFDSTTTIDDSIAASEEEQRRVRDVSRMQHPGDTTAGPPEPTTRQEVEDWFYHVVFTLGTR